MKKIIFKVAMVSFIFGCSSNDKKTTKGSQTQNEVGIQNDNGGVPDTTNAINLSTHTKDTLQKARDSIK